MMQRIAPYRPHISITVLIVLYIVGLAGLGSENRDWFLAATPLTLIVSCGLLLWNHENWNRSFLVGLACCLVLGFAVEVVGVQSGAIFGQYWYGATLGKKLLGVPLVIGLNWLLLVYAATVSFAQTGISKPLQAILGALALTILDLLMEPIAMRLDFWQWYLDKVPLQNFLAWFVVSFVMILMLQYLRFEKRNPLAISVIVLQFTFFGTLNLMI